MCGGFEEKTTMRLHIQLKDLITNQCGATVVEYCLIAGIIVFAIVGALMQLSTELKVPFTDAAAGFAN